MNFPQHSKAGAYASGAVCVISLITNQTAESIFFNSLAVYLGSIFPDLDTESTPSKWAARLGFIFVVLCLVNKNPEPAAIAGGLFFLVKSDQHRGFLHKYWFIAAFVAVGYFLHYLAFLFAMGLLVHFWVDKISPLERKNLW